VQGHDRARRERDDELSTDHPLRQLLGLASRVGGYAGCAWPGSAWPVVHHGAQAGDSDSILQYGPIAAWEASAAGAHREAAAHLRLVLDQHPILEPRAEAELWEGFVIENFPSTSRPPTR